MGRWDAVSDYDYYDNYCHAGLQRSCAGCDAPVFVGRDETYVPKVWCDRCREELEALAEQRRRKAEKGAA